MAHCLGDPKAFFFLSVKGKEHMPKRGAVVICANHVHALDPVALAMVRYRQIHLWRKRNCSVKIRQLAADGAGLPFQWIERAMISKPCARAWNI